jgi:hypothetical protein
MQHPWGISHSVVIWPVFARVRRLPACPDAADRARHPRVTRYPRKAPLGDETTFITDVQRSCTLDVRSRSVQNWSVSRTSCLNRMRVFTS